MVEPSNKRPAWTIRFFPFAISAFSRSAGTPRADIRRILFANSLIIHAIFNLQNVAHALLSAMRRTILEPPKHFGSGVA
ncbi:MAG: hypothetical protein FD177_2524 [Desulfovibrionaceae bacterium]|nr:MAG: hypothetical protein FD177_2524 [Desulfovibrionaceae bacterium]